MQRWIVIRRLMSNRFIWLRTLQQAWNRQRLCVHRARRQLLRTLLQIKSLNGAPWIAYLSELTSTRLKYPNTKLGFRAFRVYGLGLVAFHNIQSALVFGGFGCSNETVGKLRVSAQQLNIATSKLLLAPASSHTASFAGRFGIFSSSHIGAIYRAIYNIREYIG